MSPQKPSAFQLKAHYFPITVIKFSSIDPSMVLTQLNEVQQLAPNYFFQSPVVLDVTQLSRPAEGLDLLALCTLLRNQQLIPVGVQGLQAAEEPNAKAMGLAVWQYNAPEEKTSTSKESDDIIVQPTYASHIITKPVRSGMHVYAQDSNMIILAPVSSGAECIADGDIYCYAPVRGRLLAGAKDNQEAKIFCHALEAELVSIAGYYATFDEYPANKAGYFQISLANNHIEITNFASERSKLCQKSSL